MESLFSIPGESTNNLLWILPPNGKKTEDKKDFKELKTYPSKLVGWMIFSERKGEIALPVQIEKELNDAELLILADRNGSFSFLYNEEEDIYAETDGLPLK